MKAIFELEPCFANAIKLISMDNGIPMQGKAKWPDQLDVDRMDRLCRRMNVDEFEDFCIGEHEECKAVRERHGLDDLDSVLNRAFDGDLYDNFFIR